MVQGKLKQNNISEMRTLGDDLAPRWKSILKTVAKEIGFVPDWKRLRKSKWWKTGKVGAVSSHGTLQVDGKVKSAVLKIQGTRPATSEVDMIKSFSAQNESKKIRPPEVYAHLPWSDKNGFEAIVFEEVNAPYVITDHPAKEFQLKAFFDLYAEYRTNCRNKPWVVQPNDWSFENQLFKVWMPAVEAQAKGDKLRESGDLKLAEQGIGILEKNLSTADFEFVHGHFQPGDLLIVNQNEAILSSNLAWSWRVPFYDAVFGYHWWMLGMQHANNFTSDLLEKERDRWQEKIFNLPEIKGNAKNEKLVKLAFLERAIPALMVDRYMMDQTKPPAEIITKAARNELKRLIKELS